MPRRPAVKGSCNGRGEVQEATESTSGGREQGSVLGRRR